MSKASELYVARVRQRKGLQLTDRQKELLAEVKRPKSAQPVLTEKAKQHEKAKRPKPAPHVLTEHEKAKRRAKYAIQQNEGDKWFQKWIDFEDENIPVGRRRVSFVRYLTMVKKDSLETAKYKAKKYIH